MKLIKTCVIALSLITLAACGGGGGGSDSGLSHNACGTLGLQTKIVGGTSCDPSHSPVVMLNLIARNGDTYICSGTMLTQTDVLTAAHCFFDNIVGAYITANGRNISATSVYVHPGVSDQSEAIFNDVAVLKLSQAANLPTVPLVASRSVNEGDKIEIFGYGQTEDQSDTNETAGVLRSGEMAVTSVTENHIVSVYDGKGSDTCFGDSGGPATYTFDGKVGIVGITSSGTSDTCAKGDVSLFAEISNQSILDFILRIAPNAQVI